MESSGNALSCKVVLLGECAVGKTSLISRYINNTFTDDSMTTTGASFATKNMNINSDTTLKFDIWDTAGQERYRSLTKIFYRDAAVAILVYDITKRQTFEEIKSYWIDQLKLNAPKRLLIAIAANKSDLFELEEVEESEGRAFAKEIGGIFKLTSAKSNAGVEDFFKTIGNKYVDPSYDDSKTVDDLERDAIRKKTMRVGDKNNKHNKKGGCC